MNQLNQAVKLSGQSESLVEKQILATAEVMNQDEMEVCVAEYYKLSDK